MTRPGQVCPHEPLSKDKFQSLLAQGWSRVWPLVGGMGTMADKMGLTDTKTISRGVSASNLPEAHTIFNSLLADPTALDEILKCYGLKVCPRTANAANDMTTLSGLCETAGEMAEALKDGIRIHTETLRVADKLRPHMPALTAIISEADELRAVR